MRGISKGATTLSFGEFGLQALTCGFVTSRQIEAARIAISRHVKRGGKLYIRIFPDKPISKKPAETRMGHGKGNPEEWVAVVRPGRVMYELEGVDETLARQAFHLAEHKLSVQTRFLSRGRGAVMKGVRAKDLRGNDPAELRSTVRKLEEDLFKHRLKKNTNQLENTMLIRNTRRDIARVNTVLAERSRATGDAPAAPRPTKAKRRRAERSQARAEEADPRNRRPNVAGHKIHKRRMIGVVTSDKMNKTRVVLVERRVSRPQVRQVHDQPTKYKAHDEKNEFKTGDRVQIVESRPLSSRQALARRETDRTAARGLRGKSAAMVQTTTTLDVADNSGAKKIMCIRVLGGTRRKYASIGDVIVVSIKEAIPNAKVKKGEVAKAVIVRTKKEVSRAGRLVHPLRHQLGRARRQGQRAGRDAHLRPGRARAAREAVHEDHLARSGGSVVMHVRKGDQVVVIAGKEKGKRGRVLRLLTEQGPRRHRAHQHGQAPHQADAAQPARRHPREGRLGRGVERRALVRQVRRPAAREGRRQ